MIQMTEFQKKNLEAAKKQMSEMKLPLDLQKALKQLAENSKDKVINPDNNSNQKKKAEDL